MVIRIGDRLYQVDNNVHLIKDCQNCIYTADNKIFHLVYIQSFEAYVKKIENGNLNRYDFSLINHFPRNFLRITGQWKIKHLKQ